MSEKKNVNVGNILFCISFFLKDLLVRLTGMDIFLGLYIFFSRDQSEWNMKHVDGGETRGAPGG